MINRILLCVDGSAHARAASNYACHLADKLSAGVTAMHVIDTRERSLLYLADLGAALGASTYQAFLPKLNKIMSEKGDVILRDVADQFSGSAVKLTTNAEHGPLLKTILKSEEKCDLVVLGKRGEAENDGDSVIGSGVEWIVRRSIKPCLLVVPGAGTSPKHIMVACDGSDHANKALATAIELAKRLSAKLMIITVAAQNADPDHFKSVLDEAERVAVDAGVEPVTLLRTGLAADTIMRYVRKRKVDLLVAGAYGHTLLREYLIGSTTFELILRAEIPVLLVR